MRVKRLHLVPDSAREMGLAHSAASVDKERIERRVTRLFGDRQTGRAGEFVRLAGYERVKRI